jgi:GNAT superfamily N-acetyltransferase
MEGQVELEFRKANTEDAAQVSSLIGSTWAKFFAYSVTESDLETYLTQTVSEAQIRKEIEDESRYCLLAVRPAKDTSPGQPTTSATASTVVGVAQLNFNTTEEGLITSKPVKLDRLYVQPTEQGGGLAALLLQAAEEEAKKRGYNGLWLGVWENNARAIRFYEKMGYIRRGEHFFWLGESKRRDWTMEKSL